MGTKLGLGCRLCHAMLHHTVKKHIVPATPDWLFDITIVVQAAAVLPLMPPDPGCRPRGVQATPTRHRVRDSWPR